MSARFLIRRNENGRLEVEVDLKGWPAVIGVCAFLGSSMTIVWLKIGGFL
jgi:hypothetical protein